MDTEIDGFRGINCLKTTGPERSNTPSAVCDVHAQAHTHSAAPCAMPFMGKVYVSVTMQAFFFKGFFQDNIVFI